MVTFLKILGALLVLVLLFEIGQFLFYFNKAQKLSKNNEKFSYRPQNPKLKILVAGDSTAAGVGAKDPKDSVAGRFHQDFPKAEIVNLAESGNRIEDIKKFLEGIDEKRDLVVLHAGANDILYLGSLEKSKKDLKKLLTEAKRLSDNVVFLTSGNIGLSPVFFWPLGRFYSRRSKRFLSEFENIAENKGVVFVDLYQKKSKDLFSKNVDKYYASDRLHLSSTGYQVWYKKIWEAMEEAGIDIQDD